MSKPFQFTTASALLDAENCDRFADGIAEARARAIEHGGKHWTAVWSRETGFVAAAIVGSEGPERVSLVGPVGRDEAAEWMTAPLAPANSVVRH